MDAAGGAVAFFLDLYVFRSNIYDDASGDEGDGEKK